ncbi:MAG: BTAD domain-containing putative transcriptional regulator [Jatrophihabitantaceae bacterium]
MTAAVESAIELPQVRFGVLGPLTAHVRERPVMLGPLKQQLVFAMLACRANTVTSVDLLTETLWGDDPPRTARKNLQVYVACLRKLLADDGTGDRLVHRNGGYLLRANSNELDLLRFDELIALARQADGPAAKASQLDAALQLWRGPILDGLAAAPTVQGEVARLSRRYLAVFEDWAEAELSIGNAGNVVERICEVAGRHPFRERLRQIQMTALNLCGRKTEALSVFDDLRQSLARELGLRPSPTLERLYRTLLSDEPSGGPRRSTTVRPAPRVVLPPDLVDFTGYAEQVQQLHRLLDTSPNPLVVIAGPVGAGKTALALHAAHQLAERFPDGRIFLRLRTEQATARGDRTVLNELARLAGLSDQSAADPVDVDELAGRCQSWLMRHRVLLVLDGADAPGSADLIRMITPLAGSSRVLATARAGLDFGERLELAPIEPPAAVDLLGRIIGVERVGSDPAAAEQIVLAVGLLPLAIRAAGAKLARLRHLPLAEFAARLQDPDAVLDELSTGDCVLRQRLAAGFGDLPDEARSALRRLGSLETPWFTLDQAVEALAEVPGRVRRLLESLIEANAVTAPSSEVTAHAVVYQLPTLLRCYARGLPAT